MAKTDYYIGAVIGFFFSVFLFPVYLIFHIPYGLIPALFVLPMALIPLGLYFGIFLQEIFGMGARFSRYAAAGILSFSIDFSVLNMLSFLTGITAGGSVGWINIPGFCFGLTNAYMWNKLWVFKKHDGSHRAHFPRFLFVVGIGLALNSLLVVFITTKFIPPFDFSDQLWLNVAKFVASVAVIIWNFFGYKFIAFR